MDRELIIQLAALGIIIVDLNEPRVLHEVLSQILDEDYELDRKEHGKNKEWNRE